MKSPLPLPTLLSQVLVSFTIEFDNEFERQMPHRTTNHGSTAPGSDAPWLVSLAMWSNCMQFVTEEGVTVRELERLARTGTNVDGMRRWGYIAIGPSDKKLRPTRAGLRAQGIWRPLFGVIEKRWQERYGESRIRRLRESLYSLVSRFDIDLPDCLPILRYGLFSKVEPRERSGDPRASDFSLPALLSRTLLAFAIDFERESDVSLAICANVLRILDERGERVRNLPLLSGVSKEAIAMALNFLRTKHLALIEPGKVARLTSGGMAAKTLYVRLLATIEERWQTRFGNEAVATLRELLDPMASAPAPQPYPDGWRASLRNPKTLPHYPMVLHRGGFPDGS